MKACMILPFYLDKPLQLLGSFGRSYLSFSQRDAREDLVFSAFFGPPSLDHHQPHHPSYRGCTFTSTLCINRLTAPYLHDIFNSSSCGFGEAKENDIVIINYSGDGIEGDGEKQLALFDKRYLAHSL